MLLRVTKIASFLGHRTGLLNQDTCHEREEARLVDLGGNARHGLAVARSLNPVFGLFCIVEDVQGIDDAYEPRLTLFVDVNTAASTRGFRANSPDLLNRRCELPNQE